MPNRQLTESEMHNLFRPLLDEVRGQLQRLSGGDEALHWALRRKLTKELSYDERGKPRWRRQLKAAKRREQNGRCAICSQELPDQNVVLDRFEAMTGYTTENTRLLCRDCDYRVQASRGFT